MIKIENINVFGWEAAIRGMRNPMNSWDKSDSEFNFPTCEYCPHDDMEYDCDLYNCITIGQDDMDLMQRLRLAGSDHRKYLRMINVQMDITAPLYWWKEFDTYKVGTVANSCSTMHKIHSKVFELDDFSHEHIKGLVSTNENNPFDALNHTIDSLNWARNEFLKTGNKEYWWQMIQLLPSSYNQRRTVQLNYEVLLNMYNARYNHKLDEWRKFCIKMEKLPYFVEVCLEE